MTKITSIPFVLFELQPLKLMCFSMKMGLIAIFTKWHCRKFDLINKSAIQTTKEFYPLTDHKKVYLKVLVTYGLNCGILGKV